VSSTASGAAHHQQSIDHEAPTLGCSHCTEPYAAAARCSFATTVGRGSLIWAARVLELAMHMNPMHLARTYRQEPPSRTDSRSQQPQPLWQQSAAAFRSAWWRGVEGSMQLRAGDRAGALGSSVPDRSTASARDLPMAPGFCMRHRVFSQCAVNPVMFVSRDGECNVAFASAAFVAASRLWIAPVARWSGQGGLDRRTDFRVRVRRREGREARAALGVARRDP